MTAKVTPICTSQLTRLAKSDHGDIIRAEQWIDACFQKDLAKHRKWHRKIKTKLHDALLWKKRLEAEKANEADARTKSLGEDMRP